MKTSESMDVFDTFQNNFSTIFQLNEKLFVSNQIVIDIEPHTPYVLYTPPCSLQTAALQSTPIKLNYHQWIKGAEAISGNSRRPSINPQTTPIGGVCRKLPWVEKPDPPFSVRTYWVSREKVWDERREQAKSGEGNGHGGGGGGI